MSASWACSGTGLGFIKTTAQCSPISSLLYFWSLLKSHIGTHEVQQHQTRQILLSLSKEISTECLLFPNYAIKFSSDGIYGYHHTDSFSLTFFHGHQKDHNGPIRGGCLPYLGLSAQFPLRNYLWQELLIHFVKENFSPDVPLYIISMKSLIW